ncbi:hypothetical protein [Methylobacter luteus]|nr:hypothetical protein [Methylobacter luteus]
MRRLEGLFFEEPDEHMAEHFFMITPVKLPVSEKSWSSSPVMKLEY